MGNFVGEFKTSVLPTITVFEGNQYPLSKEDKSENKNKSSKRIPVEHINAKIKAFKSK